MKRIFKRKNKKKVRISVVYDLRIYIMVPFLSSSIYVTIIESIEVIQSEKKNFLREMQGD